MLTELERRAMEMLLDGDDEQLAVLRTQFGSATLSERVYSDSGFYVHFDVAATAPRLPSARSMVIDDLYAEVEGFQNPIAFLLFVNEGALDVLECVSIGDDPRSDSGKLRRAYYVRPLAPGSPREVETNERDIPYALGDGRYRHRPGTIN